MNCPNINIKSVINEFNDIIVAFGGNPMTIEEFKSKDVRNMRSGVDNSAMQIAYYVWDKTNGEGLAALPEYINSSEMDDMQRIRNIVNDMLGVKKPKRLLSPKEVINGVISVNRRLSSRLGQYSISTNIIYDSSSNVSAKMSIDKNSGAMVLTINAAKASPYTLFHEYSHPIMIAIRRTDSKRFYDIYNDLAESDEFKEILVSAQKIVFEAYDVSDTHIFEEEIIAAAIEEYFKRKDSNMTISDKLKKFIKNIYKAILRLFGINDSSSNMDFENIRTFNDFIQFLESSNNQLIPDNISFLDEDPDIEVIEIDDINVVAADEDLEDIHQNEDAIEAEDNAEEGANDGDNNAGRIGAGAYYKASKWAYSDEEGPGLSFFEDYFKEYDEASAREKVKIDIFRFVRQGLRDKFAAKRHKYNDISIRNDNDQLTLDPDFLRKLGLSESLVKKLAPNFKKSYKPRKAPDGTSIPAHIYRQFSNAVYLISHGGIKTRGDVILDKDLGDNVPAKLSSRIVDMLNASPNGSTKYDFDVSTIRNILPIEVRVFNEFFDEFKDKSFKWAEENNKPMPTKVNNRRLAKRYEEYIEEKYPLKLIEASKSQLTYGLHGVISSKLSKAIDNGSVSSTGGEILISNGILPSSGHTYNVKGGSAVGSINSMGWFIDYQVGDINLLYEYQSDFADGDWEIDISNILGSLSDNKIETAIGLLISDKKDRKMSLEYIDTISSLAEVIHSSIARGARSVSDGGVYRLLKALNINIMSIYSLLDNLWEAEDALKLYTKATAKERLYGFKLSKYSYKQLIALNNIANTKPNKKDSQADLSYKVRSKLIEFDPGNRLFGKVGIDVSLDEFKSRLSKVIGIRKAASNAKGPVIDGTQRFKDLISKIKFQISRWESIYGPEGEAYEITNREARRINIKEIRDSGIMAIDAYSHMYMERVAEHLYNQFLTPISDIVDSANPKYSSGETDDGYGKMRHAQILRDEILSIKNKWFYKSLLTSLVYSKAKGRDIVYLPTGKFMEMAGDAVGPYITREEDPSKIGGIYRALEKIPGLKFETVTLDEFKAPVIEVDISGFNSDTIERFSKTAEGEQASPPDPNMQKKTRAEIESEYMAPYRKAFDTIRRKFNIKEGRELLASKWVLARMTKAYNNDNSNPFYIYTEETIRDRDYYNQVDTVIRIGLKPHKQIEANSEIDRLYNEQFASQEKQEIEPISSDEMLGIAFDTEDSAETQIQPRDGVQTDMLDELFRFQRSRKNRASKRSIKLAGKLAKRLYERFGIRYVVVSKEAAYNMLKSPGNRFGANAEDIDSIAGFYDKQARTAYVVGDNFSAETTFHEIFGHPFLDILKSTPELRPLYNQLAIEAAKRVDSVEFVRSRYYSDDNSIKADEVIIDALANEFDSMVESSDFKQLLYRFYEFVTDMLNKIFRKSDLIKMIRPNATLESVARWAAFGSDKVSLVGGQQGQALGDSADKIMAKFKGVEFDDNESSIVSFFDMLEIADNESRVIISDMADEIGIISTDQLVENIRARLRSVKFNQSKIMNNDGSVAVTFEWRTDGVTLFVSSISSDNASKSSIIISILNAMKDRPELRLAMMSSDLSLEIMNDINNRMLIDIVSSSKMVIDGVEHYIINKSIANGQNYAFRRKAFVSSKVVSITDAKDFIGTTVDGLKSQLKEMERKSTFSPSEIERVRDVISKMEAADEMHSILAFMEHADDELDRLDRKISELNAIKAMDELFDNAELQDIKVNFSSLYSKAIQSIDSIHADPSGALRSLPASMKEDVDNKLANMKSKISSIDTSIKSLSKYAFLNVLKEAGDKVGSTTIDQKVGQAPIGKDSKGDDMYNNIYLEDKDISAVASFVFGLGKSSKEQLRVISKIVTDVNSNVAFEMENGEVGRALKSLKDKWDKIRDKEKLATYERIMEKVDGKFTGALISDLLYGKFKADYRDFKESLRVKYGLRTANDVPLDKVKLYAYMDEVNDWLSKHAERRYTPGYYKLRSSLSVEAREAMDAASTAISSFLKINDLIDEDGYPATEKMTPEQKNAYNELKRAKKSLAMTRYPDGSPKMEGSVAHRIAIEISNFNEILRANVGYNPNKAAFEKKRAKMEKTLSSAAYKKWLKDNTRTVYSQAFWDALASLAEDAPAQSKAIEEAMNARSTILSMHKNPDTMEVDADRLEAEPYPGDPSKTLADRVRELDKIILNGRNKGSKERAAMFAKIAKSEPTEEYLRMEREARASTDMMAWSDFIQKTNYIGSNGKLTRYSQYSKLVPVQKNMISVEPNSLWGELDQESAFVNNNYSEEMAEDGIQPKRDIYDNSEEYNKVMSDPLWADFRNSIRSTYKMLNKKYSYLTNPNSLMLAQIPAGFLRRITAHDNILKGLKAYFSDLFSVKSYDTAFGDYDTRGLFRADGSPTMFIPTRYRTLLDNPNEISRDLLGSLALYAKSAVSYSLMSKREADISVLLDGLKATKVSGNEGGDADSEMAGETKLYKVARDYVESNVYGRAGNKYDIRIPKDASRFVPMILKKLRIKKNVPDLKPGEYVRISMAKPIVNFLSYVRKINLSFNVRAIIVNLIGAELHMKIEANLGSAITNKTWWFANKELTANMPDIMLNSMTNRSSNKIISLMRMFNVVRSTEADMKGLHGLKLANFIASNIHYGPYSAGDFVVKGRMMIAVLSNIKLYEGAFYTRDQFANKFYKDNRSTGYDVFDNIQESLYGAFEVSEDGMLGVVEKYSSAINTELLENISASMATLARKLDGTMSGAEKTRMHNDAIAQAILLHRGWLLNAISERFHPKIYDYEKQMVVSGMYRGENVSTAFKIIGKFIGAQLSNLRRMNIKSMAKTNLESVSDSFESGQVYQAKRMINEISTIIALSIITTIMGRLVPLEGDTPEKLKKDEDSWQMWAYIFMLRTSMEFYALYSPGDVYGIVGSPTAAEGTMKNLQEMYEITFDGSSTDLISSGRYKYKSKLERAFIKSVPGLKQFYENIISPDLSSIEDFILENIPGKMGLYNRVINPETEIEKMAKERRQLKLQRSKDLEKARKRARKNADEGNF